jgi:hypothetical protein
MSNQEMEGAKANALGWYETINELVERTNNQELNEKDREAAMTEIQEGPLEVAVRDGWHSPGQPSQDGAEEFYILLSTGGPALRIWGTLDNGQPAECELQMQDWFTPWIKWVPEPYDSEYRDTLRAYASCFYFGD